MFVLSNPEPLNSHLKGGGLSQAQLQNWAGGPGAKVSTAWVRGLDLCVPVGLLSAPLGQGCEGEAGPCVQGGAGGLVELPSL